MDYRNMNTDRINELRKEWEAEEKIAHIHRPWGSFYVISVGISYN